MSVYLVYVVLWIRFIQESERNFHSIMTWEVEVVEVVVDNVDVDVFNVCCAMDKIDSGIGGSFSPAKAPGQPISRRTKWKW